MVVDEFGAGQPAGWCLSNRETEDFMKLFCSKIRENCEQIKPSWFMSDIAPQFYEAFCTTNECQSKRLLCIWHVDKAWKEELRKKIGNVEIEVEIYKMMRVVLEQVDEKLFDDYLSNLMERLEASSKTENFAIYFKKFWVERKRQWGFCFRTGDGINTNMFCEAFHKVFKYQYLKGKYNKRVDTCLVNLIKFNRDKTFERLIKLTKGKSMQRMKMMNERHKKSAALSFTILEKKPENLWYVKSDDGKQTYQITPLVERCEEAACQLRCIDCGVCCHTYHCTCPDFLLKKYQL